MANKQREADSEQFRKYLELRGEYLQKLEDKDLLALSEAVESGFRGGVWMPVPDGPDPEWDEHCREHPHDPLCRLGSWRKHVAEIQNGLVTLLRGSDFQLITGRPDPDDAAAWEEHCRKHPADPMCLAGASDMVERFDEFLEIRADYVDDLHEHMLTDIEVGLLGRFEIQDPNGDPASVGILDPDGDPAFGAGGRHGIGR